MNPNSLTEMQARLIDYIKTRTYVDPDLYAKYDVKRGLRNSNGTGVLVGITSVSDVVGYKIENGQKIPTEGKLLYRGISLEDLVKSYEDEDRMGYEEVIFLLLFGKLPTQKELNAFTRSLSERMEFPDAFTEDVILKNPSGNVMNKLLRTLLALYSYDENPEDTSVENVLLQSINLVAKMPLMIAYAHRAQKHYFEQDSLVLHRPKHGCGIAENFLHLIRDDKAYSPEEAKLLDILLIVHADHGGGNNSAFATHVVSSSGTDTYSAIATAVASLKGPKHGGANLMVAQMIEDLKATVPNWTDRGAVMDYLRGILRKENFNKKGLIYGMGHAVYTVSDPRAVLLKARAQKLAETTGYHDDFQLLSDVESCTRELMEEKGRPICANVDLYAGLVYSMLGLDKHLYTPMFALARTAGWCAHRLEQIQDDKIMRPAYVNLTSPNDYVRIADRVD